MWQTDCHAGRPSGLSLLPMTMTWIVVTVMTSTAGSQTLAGNVAVSERGMSVAADRWLLAMVGGAVALVLAGFALLVAVQARQPEMLPADTPAGVVQRYLLALDEGDYDEAETYLSRSVLERRKKQEELSGRPYPPNRPPSSGRPSTRVVLQRVESRSDTEFWVTVALSHFSAPSPTDAQEYTSTQEFQLRQEGGAWKITSPDYPYFPF